MIKQILDYIHNYFVKEEYVGSFKIEDESLIFDKLLDGQYFMINGSVLNDGVYLYPTDKLIDEEFNGKISALAIPRDVLSLSAEIDDWLANNKSVLESPYQSESFGGYSYTKASGASGASNGSQLTWKDVFGSKLNAYRKLS